MVSKILPILRALISRLEYKGPFVKRPPTSLSQESIPEFDVLENEASPAERERLYRVRRLAKLRLANFLILWAYVVCGYIYVEYPIFWIRDQAGNRVTPVFFSVNPETAIIIIVVFAAIVIPFLWFFPRRKHFSKTFVTTDLRNVAWSRYYAIGQLEAFKKIAGITVVVSLVVAVVTAYTWNWAYLFHDLFLSFGVWLAFYLLLYCAVMWRLESLRATIDEYHPQLIEQIREGSTGESKIIIPTRCYKDDSYNICVNVTPTWKDPTDYFEAELQAAGIKVSGNEKQRLSVRNPKLLFFWNCNFTTPGNHMVNVLLRLTNGQGKAKKELLHKTYEVHVITLYRQYGPALVTVAIGVITLVLGFANVPGVIPALQNATSLISP